MQRPLLGVVLFLIGCTVPAPSDNARSTPSASVVVASAGPSPSTAALPLFDAHVHYNASAWSILTPQQALERLARAGVRRAIVSSAPDEGTLRLYELAPAVVVPFLRPYRDESAPSTWARDGTVVAYAKAQYRSGIHRGIGEIHLRSGESELPVVRAIFDLALSEHLWLEIHTDASGIDEAMRGRAGGIRVLWAHAGQTATPAEVERLIARYPSLWVELSGRSDIAPNDRIDPTWRELFVRYPDRFLIGSDTWINSQWEQLETIEARTQAWLAQLPEDVARKIASGNGDALFPR